MKLHPVRVYASDEPLPREDQLAWKIAEVAAEKIDATDAVADMVINRIIDNASVATASLRRGPIISSRSQAAAHPVERAVIVDIGKAAEAARQLVLINRLAPGSKAVGHID